MVFSPDRRESGPDLQSASSGSPRESVLAPGHGHEKKTDHGQYSAVGAQRTDYLCPGLRDVLIDVIAAECHPKPKTRSMGLDAYSRLSIISDTGLAIDCLPSAS
jgi:hypothetical protein